MIILFTNKKNANKSELTKEKIVRYDQMVLQRPPYYAHCEQQDVIG